MLAEAPPVNERGGELAAVLAAGDLGCRLHIASPRSDHPEVDVGVGRSDLYQRVVADELRQIVAASPARGDVIQSQPSLRAVEQLCSACAV
jgi:hypothetical protein